jgi:hypothetical protein
LRVSTAGQHRNGRTGGQKASRRCRTPHPRNPCSWVGCRWPAGSERPMQRCDCKPDQAPFQTQRIPSLRDVDAGSRSRVKGSPQPARLAGADGSQGRSAASCRMSTLLTMPGPKGVNPSAVRLVAIFERQRASIAIDKILASGR